MKKIGVKIIVGVVCVALAGGGVIAYKNSRPKQDKVVTSVASNDFEFEEGQTKEEVESSVTKGIQIPGYGVIPIAANTQDVSIDLTNPSENDVYFRITFYLTDTDEQIYQSKLISPGQHLYDITLDRALEEGEYNLTIQYETFSMDGSYTPKNGASINCILDVNV